MKPVRATLTKKQKNFLFYYFPEDRMFTSEEEIKKIADALKLEGDHPEEWYRKLRNAVVVFYHTRIDSNFKYMYSMQSVTAVIDHYKVKKGYPV